MKRAIIAGLIVMSAGAAWSAQNAGDTGTPNAMQGSLTAHPVSLTGTELNAYSHDPAINLPDKLGNYAQDYRAMYPDHVALSGVGLSKPTLVK